ncbi:ENTH-domain-containing protein [Peniophora sp. CONT]|nr:ENTH-domain-containing protein [Peniophora sp. CONT]
MDRLTDLSSTLSNLTMYDIKSAYNQAKNMVLNVSEMEGKVREATNDDPWGASSTLMTEIAQGTFNFQNFNEIMPCIYSQFMEKEARQWRQIYKALQLLEYLVKHGSERVVDDARSHISTLKMLRSFHYIDDKGKDQGINVRNRSKELVELLSDVEKIRNERRKAKQNKNKYTGVGNDGMSFTGSFGGGGSGRYGGFGSDSLGGGGSSSYSNYDGSGAGYGSRASGYDRDAEYSSGGGGSSGGFRDSNSNAKFEEYDAGDYEAPRRSSSVTASGSSSSNRAPARSNTQPPAKAAAKQPEAPAKIVDLLGFDDDEPAAVNTNKALPTPAAAAPAPADSFDDEFADFVGAPVSPTSATSPIASAPSPAPAVAAVGKPNLMDLLNSAPAANAAARPPMTSHTSQGSMGGGYGMGMGMGMQQPMYAASPPPMGAMGGGMGMMSPTQPTASRTSSYSTPPPSSAAQKSSGGGFDDLWKTSLGSTGAVKPVAGAQKRMGDMAKEKASAGIWGTSVASSGSGTPKPAGMGAPLGGASGGSVGGGDDFLL